MTRVVFEKGQLDQYLSLCEVKMNMSLPQLAQIISVERHTLNDWRRNKFLPNLERLQILAKIARTPLPEILETKSNTWGSVKAGYAHQQKYGCTLSKIDRIRGWSQLSSRAKRISRILSPPRVQCAKTVHLSI